MQESEVFACETLKASENASLPLDSADEPFDDVGFFEAEFVILPLLFAIPASGEARFDLTDLKLEPQFVAVKSFCR